MDDIHYTAREWFAVKLINGATPEVWHGGIIDGLEYFPVELDGVPYGLTDVGLFHPPAAGGEAHGRKGSSEERMHGLQRVGRRNRTDLRRQ